MSDSVRARTFRNMNVQNVRVGDFVILNRFNRVRTYSVLSIEMRGTGVVWGIAPIGHGRPVIFGRADSFEIVEVVRYYN